MRRFSIINGKSRSMQFIDSSTRVSSNLTNREFAHVLCSMYAHVI